MELGGDVGVLSSGKLFCKGLAKLLTITVVAQGAIVHLADVMFSNPLKKIEKNWNSFGKEPHSYRESNSTKMFKRTIETLQRTHMLRSNAVKGS